MIDKIDGGSPYDYPKITNKRSAGIHAYDAAWQNAISEKEKQEETFRPRQNTYTNRNYNRTQENTRTYSYGRNQRKP